MKQTLNSFLQTVFQFVKSMPAKISKSSKKMYRSAIAMTTGVSMVTMMTSAAVGFQGGGRNALVAFAETPEYVSGAETALEEADTTESEANGNTKQDAEDSSEEGDPESGHESEETEKIQKERALIVQEDKTMHIKTDRRNEREDEESEINAEAESENDAEAESDQESDGRIRLPEDEYNVLLRIVQAEAGSCDETGKILVANVILNRMEDEEFPDTVSGVVYQRHQFSPVSNGSINTCKVTDETREAVDKALEGEDPSEGALYFMNRKASTGRNVRWFDSHLDFLFKHEQHEFFK